MLRYAMSLLFLSAFKVCNNCKLVFTNITFDVLRSEIIWSDTVGSISYGYNPCRKVAHVHHSSDLIVFGSCGNAVICRMEKSSRIRKNNGTRAVKYTGMQMIRDDLRSKRLHQINVSTLAIVYDLKVNKEKNWTCSVYLNCINGTWCKVRSLEINDTTYNLYKNGSILKACRVPKKKALQLTLISGALILSLIAPISFFLMCRRHYPHLHEHYTELPEIEEYKRREAFKTEIFNNRLRLMNINNFLIAKDDIELISCFSCNKVTETWQARWRENEVAVKFIKLRYKNTSTAQNLEETVHKLKKLSHIRFKRLTSIYGVCTEFENLCYVRDYIEHESIVEFIKANKDKVTWKQRVKWNIEIADAMYYLHKKRVLHRNLKGSNILLNADYRVKVTDYGYTKAVQRFQVPDNETIELTMERVEINGYHLEAIERLVNSGIVRWTAPEILKNPNNLQMYSPASDVYSFGMCLWEMIKLTVPYHECQNEMKVMDKVISGSRLRAIVGPEMMPHINDLMYSCTEYFSKQRPTFKQIRNSLIDMIPLAEKFQKALTDSNLNENEETDELLVVNKAGSRSSYFVSSVGTYREDESFEWD